MWKLCLPSLRVKVLDQKQYKVFDKSMSDKALVAIIGGSGLTEYPGLTEVETLTVETPLGLPSGKIIKGTLNGCDVVFLARHGHPHTLPPHKINYRANLLALQQLGVTEIIAVNAVGGITENMDSECICIPDQVIDYTHGREDTFFDGVFKPLDHVDFTFPYDPPLRDALKTAAETAEINVVMDGVYGATQGPRLETIAEINRMERDGCDLVGMTGMPEAVLARELNIPYACLSLVVNKAAGKSDGLITMDEIYATLESGMQKVQGIIAAFCDERSQ